MYLRQVFCALAVAGCSLGANAAVTNLGALPAGATAFSGTVTPAGPFNDVFTFSLPANLGSGYSVVNFPLSIPGVGTFNTVLSTISLVSDPDGIPFNSDDTLLSSVSGGSGNALSLNWGSSAGGSMYLNVTGITNGTLGGLYSGAISVSPVPEPETWGMLLVGMSLIALKMRRKASDPGEPPKV